MSLSIMNLILYENKGRIVYDNSRRSIELYRRTWNEKEFFRKENRCESHDAFSLVTRESTVSKEHDR